MLLEGELVLSAFQLFLQLLERFLFLLISFHLLLVGVASLLIGLFQFRNIVLFSYYICFFPLYFKLLNYIAYTWVHH